MYSSIDIDFEVYKELTVRRKTPEMTENDVVRELLGLGHAQTPQAQSNSQRQDVAGVPWVWKGVTLPHGTELRARRGGRMYDARIEDGAIVYDRKAYKAPTGAARAVTGNSVDGWLFWECKLPGKSTWMVIDELRKG